MTKLKHISKFKKGDTLIRMKPAITYRTEFDEIAGANVLIKERVDASYTKIPLEYAGRTKKKIYFKSHSKSDLHFKPGTKFGIPYEVFQNGWTRYVNPISLKELEEKIFSKDELEFMLINNLFGGDFRIACLN